METELDRLLDRVTLEPAYGHSFYKALLDAPIFALIPKGDVLRPDARVRLVMWTGLDGSQIIPFFSNTDIVDRVLATYRNVQAIRLSGRTFLDASRGATVVLNPNEPRFCRLTPPEVANLLDTGAPNAAVSCRAEPGTRVGFRQPDIPPAFVHSLVLLLSQFPVVERAYLGTLHTGEDDAVFACLLAAIVDAEERSDNLAHQLSAMLIDAQFEQNLDLVFFSADSDTATEFLRESNAFYERRVGSRVILDTAGSLQ